MAFYSAMVIKLETEIPGPRSREIVARREAATPPGAAKLTPIAVASAKGSVVVDVDGNHLIDLAGGIGVLAVGHCPQGVVDAVSEQASRLIHMCAIVGTYEPLVEVAERLNELAPGDFSKKTLLTSTGAEAVEAAVGLARYATGRQGIVTFEGGYHGRTSLTMAMTSKFALFKKGFGPFAPEVYRFPFPDVYRRPQPFSEDEWIDWHLEKLDECFISVVDPAHVAAVVVEPVQGEGGFRAAPDVWLRRLREICDEHGIVFIADEVQCGMGRTGRLFAVEHAGVVPDLMTTAKSLAAGMPLGAVTGRAEIMDSAHPGGLGGTYAGNGVVSGIFDPVAAGVGTHFWSNSIICLPENSDIFNAEFLPVFIKLIPVFCSFFGMVFSFFFYCLLTKKIKYTIKKSFIGNFFYVFFSKK
ncbi:MAG: aspartate aminotransferase family protein, partial [bacterium]